MPELIGKAQGVGAPTPHIPDPELIDDFLLESRERLAEVESQLLALERDPANTEAIHAIFRSFHSIKGLAGFLDFGAIHAFAHEVETALDLARNRRIAVDSALIDLILRSADYLKLCLRDVEVGLGDTLSATTVDIEPLRNQLRELSTGIPPQRAEGGSIAQEMATSKRGASETLRRNNGASSARAVKVDIGKLDYLVDTIGELVIAESLIRHHAIPDATHSAQLGGALNQLSRITADVQRIAMSMRMIPVGQIFRRMSRLVRDLARKSGKLAALDLIGEDTELDRNIVEELADPLMHMVRNAVDHGAESPEARAAAGKNPVARIELKACHRGGSVTIEVRDDGRGLDREKILAKARERGYVTGSGEQLGDQEVFSLIFEPGFSTAAQVTDVSGRGVGMDVVRKQIAKLRGRIEIQSRAGEGATFLIKLPLTLAIIEGLVVGIGSERYVAPVFAVKEMFRPSLESLFRLPRGGELAQVRGRLLPIVRLHRRFGVTPRSENPAEGILIVAETERGNFCLFVDELIGKQEVVIKSLGEPFRNVSGISGGCVLGNGRVGLILDVEALFGNEESD